MGDINFHAPSMIPKFPIKTPRPEGGPKVLAPNMVPSPEETDKLLQDISKFVADTLKDLRNWATGGKEIPENNEPAEFSSPQSAKALTDAQAFLKAHTLT